MLAYSVEVWAAVGEWAGAVGTIGAVGLALWIALRDARLDKDRQQREIEHEAFAVASVVVVEARYEDPESWYPQVDDMPDAQITIHNLSDEPILYPRLEHFTRPMGGMADWEFWLPPGHDHLFPSTTDVLVAGEKVSHYVTLKAAPHPEQLHPVIGFADRHNQRWRRRHSEPPQRIPAGDSEPIGGPDWYRTPAAHAVPVPPPDPPAALPTTQR